MNKKKESTQFVTKSKNDNLNLNANSFLDKAQQVDMANNFKNEVEINTPEQKKKIQK